MDWNLILGIFLLMYAVICFYVAFAKPQWIWKTGKVQFFIKFLGETGTVILLAVVGIASLFGGFFILF